MKKLILLTLFMLPFFAFAKEQPLSTTIKKVTVFIEGGQVMRTAATNLPQGKTILVVSGLSKYLDAKSMRVKGVGDFTILSTHQQLDYMNDETDEAGEALRKQIKEMNAQLTILRLEHQALSEKQSFLAENKKVAGTNTPMNVSDYSQFLKLYEDEVYKILMKKNEIDIKSAELKTKEQKLQNQLQEISGKERTAFYKLFITVQAKRAMPARFEISYYVANCGWFPTYDIRIADLKKPVNLSYKANLYQATEVDWKNVLLTFSNATPTDAGDVPELSPFYLGEYNSRKQRNGRVKKISGVVTDESGEPLIGASIIIVGTTIGTTTDFDGRYSLPVPSGRQSVMVNYLGYNTQEQVISSSRMNFALAEGLQLEEVVVTAYSSSAEPVGVFDGKKRKRKQKTEKKVSKPIQMNLSQNTTSLEFDIKEPYTVLSKPKSQLIEMRNFDMPADFEYQIVPKIEQAAYLMAYIPDWEKYNLLDGESNLYFENTFVGTALIDATSVSDTLMLSLGKDKAISVTRTNVKDKSKKQFLGGKKIIKKTWKIEIKNNKPVAVKILVMDQVPISRKDKIEVSNVSTDNGQLDEITGQVEWQREIPAYSKKNFSINYTVKYPKGWSVLVE